MTSMAVQTPKSIPWRLSNARLRELSVGLLGVHAAHAGLIVATRLGRVSLPTSQDICSFSVGVGH